MCMIVYPINMLEKSLLFPGMYFRHIMHATYDCAASASTSAVAENKPILPVKHPDNPIVFMDIEIGHVSKGRIIFEVQ